MIDFSVLAARAQAPVAIEPFHTWTFPDGTLWTAFYRANDGYLLRFPDLADFQVSADALHVTSFPVPEVSDATVRHLYLNQVLPLVLSKQGKLVFHASAVEVAGGAIAFAAESGYGKSTLAASFAVSGFRFLTDDGLVVEPTADGHRILPSHPSIRLWEDSEAALIAPGVRTAPALPFTPKSRFLAGDEIRFCDQPRPLRRVYFLGNGKVATLAFQRLSAAEALVEWVKHSFLLDVEEKPRLASHFDQVAKLANQPIHYRLDYPRRFEELAWVRAAIVEQARSEG
ncbi:hypothetical protein E4P82_07065 [Candidatus Competibacter phosphatis]|uniref:Serine kinase n=1 Tax=Candidatus Competibacter phosphatis TaxID=221280 RepID=A0ABX1THY2_9GAMM|nr:hypothetical protein [Candidatus Competibacter phosphatis]NMQ18988.1 hypothetical protein [Candidatus Competibacter phosphatis]